MRWDLRCAACEQVGEYQGARLEEARTQPCHFCATSGTLTWVPTPHPFTIRGYRAANGYSS